MNNLQQYRDISLETALIPDPLVRKFITDEWLIKYNKEQQKRIITHMFSAYLFYQVIMRTSLRSRTYNGERINIFVLDQHTGVCLMEYFDEINEVGEMDITSNIPIKKRGPPEKVLKLTPAEKQKRYRERKKQLPD